MHIDETREKPELKSGVEIFNKVWVRMIVMYHITLNIRIYTTEKPNIFKAEFEADIKGIGIGKGELIAKGNGEHHITVRGIPVYVKITKWRIRNNKASCHILVKANRFLWLTLVNENIESYDLSKLNY
jgi:hypothetical protein